MARLGALGLKVLLYSLLNRRLMAHKNTKICLFFFIYILSIVYDIDLGLHANQHAIRKRL